MSGIFGKKTTAPAGFEGTPAAAPAPDPNAQGGGDPNAQGGDPNAQSVPEFEGAESGGVADSRPVTIPDPNRIFNANNGGGDPNAQGGNPNNGGGDPNAQGGDPNAQGGDPNAQSTPGMESVALQAKEAALAAKESELAAKEAAFAATQQNGGESEEETPASVFGDIDPETLESEGEKVLLEAGRKIEEQLQAANKRVEDAEKQAQEATNSSDDLKFENDLRQVQAQYGVTRAELETAYQNSGGRVRDLDTLAKGVLFDKAQANAGPTTQEQAKRERTQGASQITGSPNTAQGANRNTGQGPRGNIKNVFDGAEVAKYFRAFE